jgi:enamine deaminase RidA (YjgF/YER057c/UK114 family)
VLKRIFAVNKSKEINPNQKFLHLPKLIQMSKSYVTAVTKWEHIGYSRAVRVGNHIEVSGTVSLDGNHVVGLGDPYEQAAFVIQKIEKALLELGSSLKDVVRTRIYITDLKDWEEIGKAHGEAFSQTKPAATLVVVKSLIAPEYLVEIEATAVVQE